MILAFASGMATFSCHDPDNVFDLVPCDVVASAVLGAAAGVAAGGSPCGPGKLPLIVHASSSTSYCERYG
jgi:fatty acyl-CoA reductase